MSRLVRRLWLTFKGCRHGHLWFPAMTPREFIPFPQTCLRCTATRVVFPTGECLGRHPIREHYDDHGNLVSHPDCPGPQ